jgi:hypothetical protein
MNKKPKLSREDETFDLMAEAASRGFLNKGALFVPLKVRLETQARRACYYGCLSVQGQAGVKPSLDSNRLPEYGAGTASDVLHILMCLQRSGLLAGRLFLLLAVLRQLHAPLTMETTASTAFLSGGS